MILRIVGTKLWLQIFLLVVCLPVLLPSTADGQTYGPLSPNAGATGNNTSIGTNAWSNPNRSVSSNDNYSTITTRGVTQYLSTANFGFAIPGTSTINGIQVEVERSVPSFTSVALLDNWSTGLTKTISGGTDRCLVVLATTENGNGATDVTALTYGGQTMTQVGEFSVGTVGGFMNRIEVWILREAGIAAASNTTLAPTISATSYIENAEIYSSAVFQFVDQYNPVFQVQNSSSTATTTPYQLASALNTLVGSMSVAAITCGNNTTPGVGIGGTNTYTINSTFTEDLDIYHANAGFATSGFSLEISHKASASNSTEQPSFTFAGTPNRQVAVAFTLRAATGLDNSVRLLKAGVITGNNYAQATVSWPTTDTYASYGGSTDLWGTTWTPADINATNFGVVFSAIHQSGTLQVDHIRVTVYATAAMPVELVYFRGNVVDDVVVLTWETATELNNDFFTVERSTDGREFSTVATLDGAGNSLTPIQYSTTDKNFYTKRVYYRLKQTDFDEQFTYSDVIRVDTEDLVRDLVFFPNPANASISVINSSEDDVAIRILSQSGVVVFNKIQNRQFDDIDISEIPQGFYLVELRRGQTRKLEKLVITH